MVENDTNNTNDIFVYDRDTDAIERVSISDSGVQAFESSISPSISGDGRYVAFESRARTLVPGDTSSSDVFLYDRDTDSIKGITVTGSGFNNIGLSSEADVSTNGQYVAFTSGKSDLVGGDTNNSGDIFVYDIQAETFERVSVGNGDVEGNSDSGVAKLSADGRYVVFKSFSDNLVEGDTNNSNDIFVRDRQTGITERVSFETDGSERIDGNFNNNLTISGDGRFVAYNDNAPGIDPNSFGGWGLFLFDRDTDTTVRIDVDENGSPISDGTSRPVISDNGQFISFIANIDNPRGDRPNQSSSISAIFVYDRQNNQLNNLSQDINGTFPNDASYVPDISADGRYVTFSSDASNWLNDDTNGARDIFVYDRGEGFGGGSNGEGSGNNDGIPKVSNLLIDLTDIDQATITTSFEVLREAGFNNTVGLLHELKTNRAPSEIR